MNKVLFLDFDGVLFDTLREVYLVSRYIAQNKDFLEEIDTANYALFGKYKYLVYNIWMFNYYNPLIFGGCKESDIVSKYEYALLKRDKAKEKIFYDDFIDARRKLINNHFEFWKNLEVPYMFFYEIKKIFDNGNKDMVIISKKNKKSIIERFQAYDFALDKIYACEALDNYSSKGEFINEYMDKNGYDSAIFVDDNINNIKTVDNKNVKTILALWGNTQPGYAGYSQEEAIKEIKNYCILR